MTRGKRTCKILKEIRQEIADKNEIAYTSSECRFEGECQGTCPKCEAELKYIENELHKRTRLGKTATIAGFSLGIAGSFTSCDFSEQPEVWMGEIVEDTVAITDTIPVDTIPKIIEFDGVCGFIDGEPYDTAKLNDGEFIWTIVETMPEFIGGEEARMIFLRDNLIYPKEEKEKGIYGKVVVGFVVEKDGSLTNLKILRSVSPALDEEVLRVVKLMPKWKPAEQKGKTVRAQYTMPITFSLSD